MSRKLSDAERKRRKYERRLREEEELRRLRSYDDKGRPPFPTVINEFPHTADELAFLKAIDDYKRRHGVVAPDWPAVLGIARRLGWRKETAMPTDLTVVHPKPTTVGCGCQCCQAGTDGGVIGVQFSGGAFDGQSLNLAPQSDPGCYWSGVITSRDGTKRFVIEATCVETSPGPPPIYQESFKVSSYYLGAGSAWFPGTPAFAIYDAPAGPIDCSKINLTGMIGVGNTNVTLTFTGTAS